jgi:transposase InsO family protein
MSRHWLRKYPNLTKERVVTASEQLWVSDITYIKTQEGNCYLNMVTDAYSRKIMGYAIADTMNTDAMIPAYRMALRKRIHKSEQLVHHTDRGLQYCSSDYIQLSLKNNVNISMTENGDPYENALAERMNRTLKEEFGLGNNLPSKKVAVKLVEEAVEIYNNRRPHWALKLDTPNNVHLQKIPVTVATGII